MPLGDYGTTPSRYVYSPATAPCTVGPRLLIGSELILGRPVARPAGLSRPKDAQFDQGRCGLVDPVYLSGFEAHG